MFQPHTYSGVDTAIPSYNLLFTIISIVLKPNTFIPPNTVPISLILDFTCLFFSKVYIALKMHNELH